MVNNNYIIIINSFIRLFNDLYSLSSYINLLWENYLYEIYAKLGNVE